MKRISILIILCALSISLSAQLINNVPDFEKKSSITIGLLEGGGGLVGADLEFLVSKQVGIQLGACIIGFGAGLNYHFKPSIRSSYISLQYWNQGVGKTFYQNVIGPSFVFRGKRWFTAQLGFGFPLSKGPAFPKTIEQPPVMLTYAIGAYFPF